MIKKVLVFVLIVLITVFAFCFFNAPKHEKKQEFTVWTIQLKPVATAFMENVIKEFEFQNPDFKVVWVDIPIGEAQKRTLASILTDNPPDLVNLNPDFSAILAQKNALETFDKNILKDYHEGLINQLNYNNEIFALPFYASSAVTVYNKNFISKPPETFDDLLVLAPEIKTNVFAISLTEGDTFLRILSKYNNDYFRVFNLFKELYQKNYIPKDTLNLNHREVLEKYMAENAASIQAGSNFLNMIKENAPEVYKNSDISPQLTSSGGKYDVSLMNLVIPKRALHKKEAIDFALLLTNEKNSLELSKLTNVIPANKKALENEYFKSDKGDLISKARNLSVKQLDNMSLRNENYKNKNEIQTIINSATEEVLLNKTSTSEAISKTLKEIKQLKE